jgi:hypothetical protein
MVQVVRRVAVRIEANIATPDGLAFGIPCVDDFAPIVIDIFKLLART